MQTLKGLGFLFLLALVSLRSSYTFANDDERYERIDFTSERVATMDAQNLTLVYERINPLFLRARNLINRGSNNDVDLKVIEELGKFELQESLDTLFAIYRGELKRIGEPVAKARRSVLLETLNAIEQIGSGNPPENLEKLLKLDEDSQAALAGNVLNQILKQRFAKIGTTMAKRPVFLANLNNLIQEEVVKNDGPRSRLLRAQQILESRIIGQPEVVAAAMDLEWRSKFYGAVRKLPDALYLLGSPGTGKDTTAEAFTDALHGYEGAYKSHMFKLPVMKKDEILWQVLGSSTGYAGSENFPPFLDFLVRHSGGRYKIESEEGSKGKKLYRIVENSAYKGETLDGYYAPETAVVFANEFHNWSRQLKDDFLKQALEKGYFTVNNPNGGLSEIYVPVRFIIASNEGIGLVTSREANGQRHGKPLTYEQGLAKWEGVQGNKKALKNEILSTNGSANNAPTGEAALGISEELLNRIPDRFILLMRPLSPENLQRIVEMTLVDIAKMLAEPSGMIGSSEFTWSPETVKFLQQYEYVSEDNARPVKDRVISLIEEPLIDSVRQNKIPVGQPLKLNIEISTLDDQTKELVIHIHEPDGKLTTVRQPIRYTTKDKPRDAISDSRIDELATVAEDLKKSVFGIDPILDRLGERILSIENESGDLGHRAANLIMLSGLSSTGKTETAKQLSKRVSGADDELKTFDFSKIQTMHDFKLKILGLNDAAGNSIPSEFMKLYDRNNGRMVVAFDELANVKDPDVLKSLYDLFREKVMTTFSDNKERPMGGVTIVITGNPGQEMYNAVPSHLPMEVQMAAWQEIYDRTSRDFELQRKILAGFFPEPLISRIGRNNIFFVPPLTYKALRQLAQLKLGEAIEWMKTSDSRRGWNIVFPSSQEYSRYIDTIIDEGFSLRYQGASIDSFVQDDFEVPLKALLLKNKVPAGSKVVLEYKGISANDDERKPGFVTYNVYAEGRHQPLEYKIQRPYVAKPKEHDQTQQMLVAFHEAGHSLVRKALFGDSYASTKISVIPGVTIIGSEWIYYAGVAEFEQLKDLYKTRDWVLREIATLLAGESAERLVSRGSSHTSGKANDIERVAAIARDAILRFGFSETWGLRAVPSGQSMDAFIAGLSEKQKEILEAETTKLIGEGRKLAEQTIEANFNTAFVPLGIELIEKGEMNEDDLNSFYGKHALTDPEKVSALTRIKNYGRMKFRQFLNPKRSVMVAEIDGALPKPNKVADIREITRARKLDQFAQVSLPDKVPVGTNQSYLDAKNPGIRGACGDALARASGE